MELDPANAPRGLALSVIPGGMSGYREFVSGLAVTTSGTPTISNSATGPGLYPGTGSCISYSQAVPSGQWSVEAYFQAGNSANQQGGLIGMSVGPTNDGSESIRLAVVGSGAAYASVYSGSLKSIQGANGSVPFSQINHMAATYDGTNLNLYVNGASIGSAPSGNASSFTPAYLNIGRNSWGYYNTGIILLANYATAGWSAAEVAQRAAAPMAMFRPVVRRTYFVVGGNSPTNITLSLASWHWTAAALSVNQRQQTTLTTVTETWTPKTLTTDQRQNVSLTTAAWSWVARSLYLNQRTNLTLPTVAWSWLPQTLTTSARVSITVTTAAWSWTAATLNAMQRQMFSLVAARWRWAAKVFAGYVQGNGNGGVVRQVVFGVVRAVSKHW